MADDDRTRRYDQLRPTEEESIRASRQRAYQVRNLKPLVEPTSSSLKVVEIGPGTGVTAELLREWGVRDYLAIEVCEEYVVALADLGFDCRLAKDASETLDLSVRDGSCDRILAIDV